MDSIPHARCCKCKIEKPVTEFAKGRNPGGVQSYCRKCKNKGTPRTYFPKTGPRRDFTGERNATWTAIKWVPEEQRWLCRCDCGREKYLQGYQWHAKFGNRACTCNGTERPKLPRGEAAFNVLLGNYRAGAVRRGLEFTLSRDQFRALVDQPCVYCGQPPSQIHSGTGHITPFVYSGVDRIDHTKGYTPDNCCSCCKYCNYAKSDQSMDEWKERLKRIYAHFNLGDDECDPSQ